MRRPFEVTVSPGPFEVTVSESMAPGRRPGVLDLGLNLNPLLSGAEPESSQLESAGWAQALIRPGGDSAWQSERAAGGLIRVRVPGRGTRKSPRRRQPAASVIRVHHGSSHRDRHGDTRA